MTFDVSASLLSVYLLRLKECPFLTALAEREEPNRLQTMNTIIFIRDVNGRGQEISGYIDYAHRLKNEDFEAIFAGKRRLLPKSSDLSFYNWETQTEKLNQTANFQVFFLTFFIGNNLFLGRSR